MTKDIQELQEIPISASLMAITFDYLFYISFPFVKKH